MRRGIVDQVLFGLLHPVAQVAQPLLKVTPRVASGSDFPIDVGRNILFGPSISDPRRPLRRLAGKRNADQAGIVLGMDGNSAHQNPDCSVLARLAHVRGQRLSRYGTAAQVVSFDSAGNEKIRIVAQLQIARDPFSQRTRLEQCILRIIELVAHELVGLFDPLDVGDVALASTNLDFRRRGITARLKHGRQDAEPDCHDHNSGNQCFPPDCRLPVIDQHLRKADVLKNAAFCGIVSEWTAFKRFFQRIRIVLRDFYHGAQSVQFESLLRTRMIGVSSSGATCSKSLNKRRDDESPTTTRSLA